ncbi:hypothetical protein Tco_1507318 [Tanacetum coccineum]
MALVDEHLASEEIEKMVDGKENIVDDSSIPRNDEPNIPDTRIEPRSNKESLEVEITKDKENAIANVIPSQVDASVRSYMFGHILHVHPAQSQTSSVLIQQYQLYLAMKVDPQLQQEDIAIWLALQMKFERNTVLQTACRTPAVRPRDQDDPHDDAHQMGE